MLRVLHVVTDMGRGGLETMLMNYYRNIDRTKVQFDFLTHRQKRCDYDDEIEVLGGKIYRLPRLNPWSNTYIKALQHFFAEHTEYEIVHSHIDCMSAIPLKAARDAGVPIRIAHSHSSNQDKNFKYFLKMYYKRKISNYATNLYACSEAAGKWMFGEHSFSVLPNAIDTKQYAYNIQKSIEIRKELGLDNALVIGHVGRFSEVKNHKFLVDIFNEVYKKKDNVKLLLVGDGQTLSEIRERVQRLQLSDSVIFTGIRSDVADVLQAMDVFVLPSLYEGLPVTIIEAQASGLPCLISDKVPIECKKTDLVNQIGLNETATVWTERILEVAKEERRDTSSEIVRAGFDIRENAKQLQHFYLNGRLK